MRTIINTIICMFLCNLLYAEQITCQISNIKEYDPPIHINRKHMNEVWLVKYTCINPVVGKYRLYETLDTKNVYDIKKGMVVTFDVELFGDRDVRGCIEDMQP